MHRQTFRVFPQSVGILKCFSVWCVGCDLVRDLDVSCVVISIIAFICSTTLKKDGLRMLLNRSNSVRRMVIYQRLLISINFLRGNQSVAVRE